MIKGLQDTIKKLFNAVQNIIKLPFEAIGHIVMETIKSINRALDAISKSKPINVLLFLPKKNKLIKLKGSLYEGTVKLTYNKTKYNVPFEMFEEFTDQEGKPIYVIAFYNNEFKPVSINEEGIISAEGYDTNIDFLLKYSIPKLEKRYLTPDNPFIQLIKDLAMPVAVICLIVGLYVIWDGVNQSQKNVMETVKQLQQSNQKVILQLEKISNEQLMITRGLIKATGIKIQNETQNKTLNKTIITV